ncbi:MAG: terminase small subunit [Acutalibacteraceae bacterium]|nr:terminase small subunit [Acutalibacteraceae bacterium]
MTEKQRIFCDEYLKDLNATRAYKVAYPKVKKDEVARANSSRLLTNANIKNYIDTQLEALHNERTADVREIMEYLTSVLRGESSGEEIVTEFIGDGMSEARAISKHPSEKDRLKAAELLGKRFGMFKEKVEVNGSLEAETSKLDDLIRQMSDDG